MLKRTSVADTPVRVVIVTLDPHLASATDRALATLRPELPNLEIVLHATGSWEHDPAARERCVADIATGDIVIVTMLFLEDHIQTVLPALKARQESCDAMVCCLSAGEVVRMTRLGGFRMDRSDSGVLSLLKRLRGTKSSTQNSGAQQMAMLRRLPKILRFIPGTAQDVRAYFLALQYWLAGSDDNIRNLVRLLVDRYSSGQRQGLRGKLPAAPPVEYPDVGLYHPRVPGRITTRLEDLPAPAPAADLRGTVGLLIMRSYVLAGNARHYDGVITALEARGLKVVTAFASGLDARPAIDRYFMRDGRATIDTLVSLTGFSLVGGPAYNDQKAAEAVLAGLDVPYIAAHSVEFQSIERWQSSDRGLLPIEATMMVAIPELDGASGPIVFGGRSDAAGTASPHDMIVESERAQMLAARVSKLVDLRRSRRAERKLAVVLFGFPPNAGTVGTAAFLSVWRSLHNLMRSLADAGYRVDVPADEDALRNAILVGNSSRYGTSANVHARIGADDIVRRERHLREIEQQWGAAPGRAQSDGSSVFVLGERFGNLLVAVQPAFGYEGDPMRLLFEKGFAPTHAFSTFYRYLREDFSADAVLHFGTHGALEFMPGKQTGMSAACWPDRLIADLPNFYLYAANNPSEAAIAKRRAAAVTVSYLTPPITNAGLYRGLTDLKSSIERCRALPPEAGDENARLVELIQAQAVELGLADAVPHWSAHAEVEVCRLADKVRELETTLIPSGLHVVGEPHSQAERADLLAAMAESWGAEAPTRAVIDSIAAGQMEQGTNTGRVAELQQINALLAEDHEIPALIHALDGRFVLPAPSGDLLRTPAILPTGRNIHGFDPFRMPSAFAVKDGAAQADRLLRTAMAEPGATWPESIAMVLWGTDNLKSEGGPIAQALALMGAKPRFDSYGRLSGADLVPLHEMNRPRIDVMLTLSGIFRDLLPLQTRMLAEAAWLAASVDEPADRNFIRKHALAYQAEHGCDLETAALRVFSNADSAYGSNVNSMIENGRWDSEEELVECYARRKSFAYGRKGDPVQQAALLKSILSKVDITYQNLESVELGVTTVDHYFDTLGGITRAVKSTKGTDVPVFIGDQTRGEGKVRTLADQVSLETHTRMLNPRWYEGMLRHGYEGVRQIEAHVTNTMGWSATTGQVAPWVYQRLTETYVLDPAMRTRLAELNPTASMKMANRLIEAHERNYWTPDAETLQALRDAGQEIEDRLEGVEVAA